ncbi:hypothetical protein [Halomicrobium salinisoli]|uniref:hypothetical protein n=1 Tax=Halomicrobium salinisoli TaxID=2878391 RepID=UPI001CF02521|nr:hypothetical protein [Halomicrobium salinisoli]
MPGESWNKWSLLVKITAGTIPVLGIGFVVSNNAAQLWLLQWGQVLGAIGSLFLSGLLVVLYRQQKTILAAEQRPIVEIEDDVAQDDDLIVYLSNVGKGVATGLELVTVTVFPESADVDPGVAVNALRRKPESPDDHRRGQSIKPAEEVVPFEARTSFPMHIPTNSTNSSPETVWYPDEQTSRWDFASGLARLEDQSVSVARIHFYIRYQGVLGDLHVRHVRGLEFDGNIGENTLEALHEAGGTMMYGEPELVDPDLHFDLSAAENSDTRTVV